MSLKPNLCNHNEFEMFYKNYFKDAHNFAYYKCGNSSSSLDYVQDAFLKIWKNCASINFFKAKSYLFTTINRLFLNAVKHQSIVLHYQKETPYYDKDNQNPEYIYEEEEFKKQLLTKINGLPEKQRTVLLLNRIEDKKYREIAEMLNVSIKTVEKRMSLALKALQIKTKFDK